MHGYETEGWEVRLPDLYTPGLVADNARISDKENGV